LNRLHTSIRALAPEETLARAKAWAKRARIVCVSDITPLDFLGLPVFVSRRDGAHADAFTFGKGRVPIEAEIGAYMEAIEYHFAEPGAGNVVTRLGSPSEIEGSVADYAPILDARPGREMLLALAENAESGAQGWVPAELVLCPAPGPGPELFGPSTNGLASGNTVLEASLHALFELIERDIWSIEFVRDASERVTGLPPDVAAVADKAARGGLDLVIRHVPNDFAMPFFAAFLFDPKRPEQRFFNGGWGCHLDKHIALARAVSEVAQSRAAFLHGGRAAPEDDGSVHVQIEAVTRGARSIAFDDIAEIGAADTLQAQWRDAVACLRRVTDRPIWHVVYTPEEGPLHVVRLIVPTLENFSKTTMRVGPRLQAALEADAERAA
jgi:ribosomal protein S12 methylthiotransferase accessory factor